MRLRLVVPGYDDLRAGGASGLALTEYRPAFEDILRSETLYAYAARQPEARQFSGRAPVYAVAIPGCGDVVIRHSMRGGLMGKTGSDLFLPPTRALREVVNSFRLRASGVSTPQVLAYATYSVFGVFRRADVVTREITNSADLASLLSVGADRGSREAAVEATARLIVGLTRAGAHHPDLNAMNVLLARGDAGSAAAYVLDVDRVRFHLPGDPMITQANIARFLRSIEKWRRRGITLLAADEERSLAARVTELTA